jgi:hypothetical protein
MSGEADTAFFKLHTHLVFVAKYRHRALEAQAIDVLRAIFTDVRSDARERRVRSLAGLQSVDEHTKFDGDSSCCRGHDQIQIAGMKAICDATLRLTQHDGLALDRPITRKRPFVQPQLRGNGIHAVPCQDRTAGRSEGFSMLIANIAFR